MVEFPLVPERAALVNVDLQNMFVESTPDGLDIVERVNRLADACRAAGVLVIHTRHVLRPDGSNMGVLGQINADVQAGVLNEGARTAALHDDLVVDPRDLILNKPRFGAFYGTDLEVILRSRGIDTIIISGIATNVCCDTTAREANARDIRVLFLADATATGAGPDAQAGTLLLIAFLFGEVLSTEDFLERLARAAKE